MEELKGTVEQLDREIAKKRHQENAEKQDVIIGLLASLTDGVDGLKNYVGETSKTNTDSLSKSFEGAISTLSGDIREIKIQPPVVNVPEIKMPEFPEIKLPTINVPKADAPIIPAIKIPEIKIPTIKVPKPEVTVNVPEIKIPKIAIPDIVMPDKMTVKGDVGLRDVDNKRPLPVIMMGLDGKPAPQMAGFGGGKADHFTIKEIKASVSAVLTDSTGGQYSGSNPLPVTDGFGLPIFDFMSLAETSETDTYTYKVGGSTGATVGTLTIVYVDESRRTLSTVTRT